MVGGVLIVGGGVVGAFFFPGVAAFFLKFFIALFLVVLFGGCGDRRMTLSMLCWPEGGWRTFVIGADFSPRRRGAGGFTAPRRRSQIHTDHRANCFPCRIFVLALHDSQGAYRRRRLSPRGIPQVDQSASDQLPPGR